MDNNTFSIMKKELGNEKIRILKSIDDKKEANRIALQLIKNFYEKNHKELYQETLNQKRNKDVLFIELKLKLLESKIVGVNQFIQKEEIYKIRSLIKDIKRDLSS